MFNIFEIRQERGYLKQERRIIGADCYTLVWVRFGQCTFEYRGSTAVCRKNELILIPAGVPAAELKGSGGIRESMLIRFSPSGTETTRVLPLLTRTEPLRWVTHMPELLLEKLLRLAEQWTERDRYFSVMCSALLTELIVSVSREVDEGEKAPSAIQHIERMKRYIEEHYRVKVTKNELGACINVSPNYAAALFRKLTGLTISEYVHLKRMKTAEYMLRHSQLSVQDISDHLGYSDPSYFNRVFKRIVGKLPSDLIAERTDRE
jgi:AraC family transcriptional regulator of arabinose operon